MAFFIQVSPIWDTDIQRRIKCVLISEKWHMNFIHKGKSLVIIIKVLIIASQIYSKILVVTADIVLVRVEMITFLFCRWSSTK